MLIVCKWKVNFMNNGLKLFVSITQFLLFNYKTYNLTHKLDMSDSTINRRIGVTSNQLLL
jgi:hypothetical protein